MEIPQQGKVTTVTLRKSTTAAQKPSEFGPGYIDFLKLQTEGEGGAYLEKHLLEPALLSAFGNMKGKDLLELGCGFGMHTQRLLNLDPRRIRACDLSPDMLALAEANVQDPRVKFYQRSASDLRPGQPNDDHFGNKSFHMATSAFVLENMPDEVVVGTFSEVGRVLKKGSIYVVVQLHPDWLLLISGKKEEADALERFRRYNEPHIVVLDKTEQHSYTRFYRPNEWYNSIAGGAGFCIQKDMAICIPNPKADRSLPKKYHKKAGWPVFRMTAWRKA